MDAAGSVAFDRIADDYDRTRALPETAMRRVVELLATELRGRGRTLEIGVGTGRLALPLAEAGIRMSGVDLSLPMLGKLVQKSGGRAPFPVVVGDAVVLPFPNASFGAAVAAHVLHLIPRWKDALAELGRVVRPGGAILVDVANWGGGAWKLVRDRFCLEAGIARPFVGTTDVRQVDAHMTDLGARVRSLPAVYESRLTSLEEQVLSLDQGVYSFTWSLDTRTRHAATSRTRAWAIDRFGALDRPRRTRRRIVWRAYDLA